MYVTLTNMFRLSFGAAQTRSSVQAPDNACKWNGAAENRCTAGIEWQSTENDQHVSITMKRAITSENDTVYVAAGLSTDKTMVRNCRLWMSIITSKENINSTDIFRVMIRFYYAHTMPTQHQVLKSSWE